MNGECRRTSPRRRLRGGHADELAGQAEALLRELKGTTPSPSPVYVPPFVVPVSPVTVPFISERPPPLKSSFVTSLRDVSPSRSHAPEVNAHPPPEPRKTFREVEERLNLPLIEAQGKIDQLLLQLDVAMEAQKTLSLRLEESRKQAHDATLRAQEAHELRAANEALKQQLAAANIKNNGLATAAEERDALADKVAQLEKDLAQLKQDAESENANLAEEKDNAYAQLLREKEAADEAVRRLMAQADGAHVPCEQALAEESSKRATAEANAAHLTDLLKQAAEEADANATEREALLAQLNQLQKQMSDDDSSGVIEDLRNQLAQRNAELAAKDSALADMEAKIDTLEREIEGQLDASTSALSNMDAERSASMAKLRGELRVAESKIQQLQLELEAAQRGLQDSNSSLQATHTAETKAAQLLHELEMVRKELEAERANGARAQQDSTARLEQLKSELSSVRDELQACKQREVNLAGGKGSAEHRAELLEGEVARLTAALKDMEEALRQERESADKRVKAEQDAAAAMRDELHAKITALQKSKVAGIEETDNLVSDLTNQLAQARLAKQKAEAEKEDMKMAYEKQIQDFKSAMNRAAQQHDADMQALNANHQKTVADAVQAQREERAVLHAQEMDALRQQLSDELMAANSRHNAAMKKLSDELVSKTAILETLAAELEQLREELNRTNESKTALQINIQKYSSMERSNMGTQVEAGTATAGVQTDDRKCGTIATQADIKDERVEMELKIHREAVERAKKLAAQESLSRSKQIEELETIKRAAVQDAFAKGERLREAEAAKKRLLDELAEREARLEALITELESMRGLERQMMDANGKNDALTTEAENVQEKLQEALEQLLAKKQQIERLERELEACNVRTERRASTTAWAPAPTTPVSPVLGRPPPGRFRSTPTSFSLTQQACQPPPVQPQQVCQPVPYHQHVEVEIISETPGYMRSVC